MMTKNRLGLNQFKTESGIVRAFLIIQKFRRQVLQKFKYENVCLVVWGLFYGNY